MSEHKFQHPVTEQVYAALHEIEQANHHLMESLAELPTLIGDNVELRQAVIGHLYWYEERIKPSWLAQYFQFNDNHIGKIAGPAYVTKICKTCRRQFDLMVRSKTQLKDALNDRWREQYLCETCFEKDERERSQRNQQTTSTYQAYIEAGKVRLEELRFMPYQEYLQTPEWQERRKKAMKKAGFRCQVCNAYGVRLNVHHRTYERRGNEYDSDLITLCETCHQTFHENGRLASSGKARQ